MEQKKYKQKEFIFYLLPEFTLLAFSSAIDALRLANYILGYEFYTWRIMSLDGLEVCSSSGVVVQAELSLKEENNKIAAVQKCFMTVICGGMHIERYYDRQMALWLHKCRQNNIAIASLCTGAHILAKAGLLVDKKCAIHWENIPSFMEQFSDASVNSRLFEIDGFIHTCAGGMASFDMFLYFIRQDCDDETIARICELAIIDKVRNFDDKQRLPFSVGTVRIHPVVKRLIEKMQDYICEPVSLHKLMDNLGLTRRQIERLFRAEMKISPARYYMRLRLERAKLLIQKMDMPIIEIAMASGFSSASHFSKSYRDAYGCSPIKARKMRHLQNH